MRDIATGFTSSSKTTANALRATQSSRDRGRHYRERLAAHKTQLVRHVEKLRHQVEHLKLLASLQHQLTTAAYAHGVKIAMMSCLRDILDASTSHSVKSSCDRMKINCPGAFGSLRLMVESFELRGPTESPVLVLRGSLRGQLPHAVIDRLYFCVPGNTSLLAALIDRTIEFPCCRTLFFASDGQLADDAQGTDYLTPLLRSCGTNYCTLQEMLVELNAAANAEHERKSQIPWAVSGDFTDDAHSPRPGSACRPGQSSSTPL